jgi:hypothetical protein
MQRHAKLRLLRRRLRELRLLRLLWRLLRWLRELLTPLRHLLELLWLLGSLRLLRLLRLRLYGRPAYRAIQLPFWHHRATYRALHIFPSHSMSPAHCDGAVHIERAHSPYTFTMRVVIHIVL